MAFTSFLKVTSGNAALYHIRRRREESRAYLIRRRQSRRRLKLDDTEQTCCCCWEIVSSMTIGAGWCTLTDDFLIRLSFLIELLLRERRGRAIALLVEKASSTSVLIFCKRKSSISGLSSSYCSYNGCRWYYFTNVNRPCPRLCVAV